jgi:cystathionine beta-lyase/cystathionine gamma-synthase
MNLSYILNELGEDRALNQNAVSPPVFQTSNFCFKSIESMRESLVSELKNPFYTRGNNPTVEILRRKLAALEGAEDCLVFGSGSASIAAAIMQEVKSGDHVVCVKNPYSWTKKLLENLLTHYGVTTDFVDGTNPENFRKAIKQNTKLVYLESPNSFTFELQDIKAVSKIAKDHGCTVILDNSYSSPLNQSPISLGVDVVVHSGTKYLNGHSDIVMGVLCSTKSRIEKIFNSEFMTLGGILSPHDAWLAIRGLRTLEIRMERSIKSTEKIMTFLISHPKISRILYPFHSSFPQYELAMEQMSGACGLLSFYLYADSRQEIVRFCESLHHIMMAVSWGGHESLILPGCASLQDDEFNPLNPAHRIMRMYVGLEDADYLIRDLERGFESM